MKVQNLSVSKVQKCLETQWPDSISGVLKIGAGIFSKAFAFRTQEGEYVIRFSETETDFKKDALIFRFYSRHNIPIPEIFKMGQFSEGGYFCISRRCQGQLYSELTLKKKQHALSSVQEVLDSIHEITIENSPGFGILDLDLKGHKRSWAESLLDLENHKIHYDFEYIFARPYFNKGFFDEVYNTLISLASGLVDFRYLIHGDYGFDNLMIEKDKVSGVLDWGEMRVGDPAFDWAWLDFWSDDICFAALFFNRQREREKLAQRFKACLLHIGLGAMLFAAHFDDETDYESCQIRLKLKIQKLNEFCRRN